MKIFKNILIATAAVTVSLSIFYLVTLSQMEFNFANDGKIICVVKREWGIMSGKDLTCFNISPVGQEKDVQRFNCKTINGEIVIKK